MLLDASGQDKHSDTYRMSISLSIQRLLAKKYIWGVTEKFWASYRNQGNDEIVYVQVEVV